MTVFALVRVWRGGKLGLVLIAMAIHAALKLNLELGVFPLRNVALRAFERCVLTLQRILRRRVVLHREFRRLPSFDRVASSAFTTVGTLRKLSLVRIGFVAVQAFPEDERFLEIAILMTLSAANRLMFPLQREIGFRVIEGGS